MVREINLSRPEMSSKFESSNGHKHFPTQKTKLEQDHQKGKKRKTSGAKCSRSLSSPTAFKISRSASMAPSRDSGDDWHEVKDAPFQSTEMDMDNLHNLKDKLSTHKTLNENNEFDILKKRSILLKGKGFDWSDTDVANEDDDDNLKKPAAGSSKKHMRRSIAGLAKCSAKEDGIDIANLIGYRIKVWWPTDKQFYEGTVKSYDPMKRKHVVLYEDGDVEVLRLERERWELIDGGRKSVKKARASMNSKDPPKELVQRKRTPKRHLKHVQKRALKRNADDEETADVLKSKSIAATKNHKMSSDESEGEHTEMVDKNVRDREESEKEVGSVSQEKCSEDWNESPNHGEESNKVKSTGKGNVQIGSRSRISKVLPKGSTPSPVAGTAAGISDDEPLCKWKRKVGISSTKKRMQ